MTSRRMTNSYTDVSDIPMKRIYTAPYLSTCISTNRAVKKTILHIHLNYNLRCVKTIALNFSSIAFSKCARSETHGEREECKLTVAFISGNSGWRPLHSPRQSRILATGR